MLPIVRSSKPSTVRLGDGKESNMVATRSIATMTCPACNQKTRPVKPITITSLATASVAANADSAEGFEFCSNAGCEVIYTNPSTGLQLTAEDVRVQVFQKDQSPSRLVCYCFGHTVAEVETEVLRAGNSRISESIAEKCKQGLDRCEEMNPQGSCCLGNVRNVVNKAKKQVGVVDLPNDSPPMDCCAGGATQQGQSNEATQQGQSSPSQSSGVGRLATGGALVAAMLASACCWLPLLFIGAGASVVGVAGFFEAYRFYFLGTTGLLLGAGFYYVYLRKPKCAPGEACEVPDPRLQRVNKTVLWIATVAVIGLASFPNYVSYLVGGAGNDVAAVESTLDSRTYAVAGMTCEGCASSVGTAIETVPGVASARVSYPEKIARVFFQPGSVVEDSLVLGAIESVGYEAALQDPEK